MGKTVVHACWENMWEIGDTEETAKVVANTTTFTLSTDVTVDTWHGQGSAYQNAFAIALADKIGLNAKVTEGDEGNEYLKSKWHKVGTEAQCYVGINMKDGTKIKYPNAVVAVKNIGFNDLTKTAEIEAEIHGNGEPIIVKGSAS